MGKTFDGLLLFSALRVRDADPQLQPGQRRAAVSKCGPAGGHQLCVGRAALEPHGHASVPVRLGGQRRHASPAHTDLPSVSADCLQFRRYRTVRVPTGSLNEARFRAVFAQGAGRRRRGGRARSSYSEESRRLGDLGGNASRWAAQGGRRPDMSNAVKSPTDRFFSVGHTKPQSMAAGSPKQHHRSHHLSGRHLGSLLLTKTNGKKRHIHASKKEKSGEPKKLISCKKSNRLHPKPKAKTRAKQPNSSKKGKK